MCDAAPSDRSVGAMEPDAKRVAAGAYVVLKIKRSEDLMATITEHEGGRSSGPTRRDESRSCSFTGSGCCRAAGIAGPRVQEGRLHDAHAGLAGRPARPSRRQRLTRRCSPIRRWGRSPITSPRLIGQLDDKPAVIGHSFGGLLTQILAGRGLAAASVAIDPGAVPRRAAAADLRAEVRLTGARQTGQPQPRRAAHLRAVPLRVRQRGQRGRGQGALRDVRRAGVRASRCSRRRAPTSTPGPRPRSTPRTPSAGRC